MLQRIITYILIGASLVVLLREIIHLCCSGKFGKTRKKTSCGCTCSSSCDIGNSPSAEEKKKQEA
ncbi:MAG: hypothetical protein CSB06_00205 [Bacteroidia bacterium]|nr:MAG: hypothetical protein CSB06_00205 [Bacteroidia bacterium]